MEMKRIEKHEVMSCNHAAIMFTNSWPKKNHYNDIDLEQMNITQIASRELQITQIASTMPNKATYRKAKGLYLWLSFTSSCTKQ